MNTTTEIKIDEHGDETHESWVLIRANHVQGLACLFDSEIPHQHYVVMTVTRCTRKRDLKRDWLHRTEVLLEVAMSQAQWGAFVSSFGQGGGVPATLERLVGVGRVPSAPVESRLDESHREVKEAGKEAVRKIQGDYDKLLNLFESGAGRKAMREAIRSLGFSVSGAPNNMEFAAKSLTEHVENVMTKARADFEGMVLSAVERGELSETASPFLLGSETEKK